MQHHQQASSVLQPLQLQQQPASVEGMSVGDQCQP